MKYFQSYSKRFLLKHNLGLTLVELMVAMVIGLILSAGIIQVTVSAKSTYRAQEAIARLQDNARFLTDLMIRDISASGYLGCMNSTQDVTNTLSDKSTKFNFIKPIEGIEGNDKADSIIIRRALESTAIPVTQPMLNQSGPVTVDKAHINYSSLQQWDIVTLSDCAHAAVYMITNDPSSSDGVLEHLKDIPAPDSSPHPAQKNATEDLQRIFGSDTSSPAKIYKVGASSYEIRDSDGVNPLPYPSLYYNDVELIPGVEDMQIRYGIDTDPTDNTIRVQRYVDADQVVDWNNVISLKLSLTLNSVHRIDNKEDGLMHKTFTSTIRLRNRSPQQY